MLSDPVLSDKAFFDTTDVLAQLLEEREDFLATLNAIHWRSPSDVEVYFWVANKPSSDSAGLPAKGQNLVLRGDSIEECFFKPSPIVEPVRFLASRSHIILEDYGETWSIYGQSPIPDPYRFFLEFSRVIETRYGRRRDVRDYLNWGENQQSWLNFVYSRSFLLFEGPPSLLAECTAVLDAQAASYMVLPPKVSAADNDQIAAGNKESERVFVAFGESYFVAESISVEVCAV